MARVDLVDETFVVAAPADVAAVVHEPQRWRQWWPDLQLTVFMDRGTAGVRWSVTGALYGSAELWLEPVLDGVLVHYYLRADDSVGAHPAEPADPADPADVTARRADDRLRDRRARAWKRSVNALKDELETGRAVGLPRPSP
jgi:hypothetical protein